MHWKSKREPSGEKIKLNVKPVLTKDTEDWGQEGGKSSSRHMKWQLIKSESELWHSVIWTNLFLPSYSFEDIHLDLNKMTKCCGMLNTYEW